MQSQDLKLNLGCGEKRYPHHINIDKAPLIQADLLWDLEKTPIPLKTDSVSEVICEHILEHITNLIPLLEEIHRICKPGAKIFVSAPYYKYEAAYRDPTHVRFFTEHSFDYFQDDVKFSHYSEARFKVINVELKNHFFSSVKNLHKKIIRFVPFKKILNHFMWNMFSEINYELEVIK
ncbi:methyltransferase domain-containing protein [Candidatus Pacearchaeota archaeon]|nr:methyltransferase domain-containing protein [Candidatus Pacearchaeota archaeon]